MTISRAAFALCLATTATFTAFAHAQAEAPGATPVPSPAPEPTPPPTSPPVTAAAPSPEQRAEPRILVPVVGPVPATEPAPSPPVAPPPEPPPEPADLGAATTTPAERAIPSRGVEAPPPRGLSLGVELDAGIAAGGRFPRSGLGRSVEEAVDSTFGLSVWLGGRNLIFGLSAERTGLGKDHYSTNANGETMEASYAADTLSVLGRYYFSKERPALYIGGSLGAAMPTERTTGTRAPDGISVTPGESYECSDNGRVGGAASATVGVEFEVAPRLAVLADARAAGFVMSKSDNAFGGCSPGTGSALIGAARLGLSYRFGL